jgi:hypothetical protein
MNMRWLVLFFLFLGMLSVSSCTTPTSVPSAVEASKPTDENAPKPAPKPSESKPKSVEEELAEEELKSVGEEQPAIIQPEQTATPIKEKYLPRKIRAAKVPRSLPIPRSRPTPILSPKPTELTPEDAIEKAIGKLPKGQIYHNVPEEMQVGVPELIEAGVAREVTEKIQKELQGKGKINIKSGVRYDPAGVKMKLVVSPDEFKVLGVNSGTQFISSVTPGKWVWQVIPLKAGDNLIVVKAIVDLNVPELKKTRQVEVETFSDRRNVRVNMVYSASQFVSSNWKEVLGLVIGSGSLAGLISWVIGRRDKIKA